MMTWSTLYANPSCQACTTHACMHGACTLSDFGTPMYFRLPACTQANQDLGKIATTHFGVLITQNANKNMQNMIFIT